MKHIKKLLAFAIVAVMMFSLCGLGAYAQTKPLDPADEDNASITIMNPAKGETYSLFKLFDATVDYTTTDDGTTLDSIVYIGTIPSSLTAYFEYVDGATATPPSYVKLKDGVNTANLFTALATWAETATAVNSAESDGTETLAFTGLPYGYYVITTTHEDAQAGKAIITVDSTKPNAEVYDKNASLIINEGKEADGTSYSIGDTITYTAKFLTSNYYGSGENAGKIYKYVIEDTLPEFLSNVKITSIKIDGEAWTGTPSTFDANGQITIPWVDEETGVSLYDNGAEIVVVYTAVLTSTVNVNGSNTNTISITPYDENNEPYHEPYADSFVITTYAAALKKVDDGETPKALKGAKFKGKGLVVELVDNSVPGVYRVVSYDASESAELGTEMSTDDKGMLYIVGLAEAAQVSITETVAPSGYNKLNGTATLTPQKLTEEVFTESGTRYYDADGNLVAEESSATTSKTVVKNLEDLDEDALAIVNTSGTVMPATGGIGTTIFYVVGGILLVGAAVMLVTKKRISQKF